MGSDADEQELCEDGLQKKLTEIDKDKVQLLKFTIFCYQVLVPSENMMYDRALSLFKYYINRVPPLKYDVTGNRRQWSRGWHRNVGIG